MSTRETLRYRKNRLPEYGLGVFMITAGISKFVMLELWLGYEPRFLVEFLPVAASQLTMTGGLFEVVLGALILAGRKTFYVALGTALYLSAITIQLVNLGLWDLAIRDLGLTLYALSVASQNYDI